MYCMNPEWILAFRKLPNKFLAQLEESGYGLASFLRRNNGAVLTEKFSFFLREAGRSIHW